jgi:site-specific recombinase XerD
MKNFKIFKNTGDKTYKNQNDELKSYKDYLKSANFSENTIASYVYSISRFLEKYGDIITKENLLDFSDELLEKFKPKTVNMRISGINKYLKFINQEKLMLRQITVQNKPFLDNVISLADYEFLKYALKEDNEMRDYFMVWTLGATGTRVSELVKFKVEHIEAGYFDIYSKGGKLRRVYIPKNLQSEYLFWLDSNDIKSGYLFGQKRKHMNERSVRVRLEELADRYGIDKNVMHPHSFRHMFGKNFINKRNDLALLADLMGHENLETTRIYLRMTSAEQKAIVDDVVTW